MLDTTNARVVEIHMQGGAMGNLATALFEGEERSFRDLAMNDSKLWAFNGQVGGYDVSLADFNLGDIVALHVWNDTAWPHAMHFHGQHFWVKSGEFGQEEKALLRDTYLMQPGEKKDLVFIAENPGLWLFHCHMLEHHAAGMGGVISIS
jgi:FtsP/CotA-like multicopper oxidase with cupredoxin domain